MLQPVERSAALYHPDGDRFVPTLYTQGPWHPNAQFGGAPAALVATLVDRAPSLVPMQIARLTTDLMRPVPLEPLTPDVRVVREGKRIQVVSASLFAGKTEVVRATALRLRRVDLGIEGLPDGRSANPLPDNPRERDLDPMPPHTAHAGRQAIEYLFEGTGGYYHDPTWLRLRVDVIAGERPVPVARLAHAADTASGVGQRGRRLSVHWINADVAINVVREPEGEWLSVGGRGWITGTGMGQVQATLSDTTGVSATVSLVRLVDPHDGG